MIEIKAIRRSVAKWLLPGCLGAILALLPPGEAWGGAWTQPLRGYYLKLEGATLSTDRVFDADGDEVDYISALSPGRYESKQMRAYAEYGIAPRFTLVSSIAWQDLEVAERAAIWKTKGLSDLRLGGRIGLTTGRWVTSLGLGVKIPTGYDPEEFPALGSGNFDWGAAFLFGRSFGPCYLTGDIGWTFRSGDLADELPFSLELGGRVASRLALRANLRGSSAQTNDLKGGSLDPTQVDSRFLDLSGAAIVSVGRGFDIEGGFRHSLAGKQTLAGTEYSLGLVAYR